MAYVTVQISKGNSIERKRKLVKAVTDALASTLDTKSESIIVHIEEIEREDWAVGGVLQYDKNNNKREDRDDRDDRDDRNDRKNR
ncbi:4-oxalocrotonate tautomerase family protein [Dolichospermum sp. ST_con]|jgi:4-oxalocrotonate tautomerase|nr:4-oxalocrotonate tautomerase family protein [Dolichospermum sp. ST_con]MDD1419318.1 4-oxalocrotonate tautomerase family protein [Dolichospermum sp. ST_sed1]MDD1424034.1 4-oxalocrotonate tautomerase family protein [Dolichospermum sp. ST_sed9]MDD1431393.1 4-oxalocrotonate tautomerase family protein [Dolichospermum sp. ST_sed6]MDD1436238.1 4-oxalocrotonate tautomerase family protein [Dolichospermum sp. ST_sed10]MDD1439324.1 4-oxalocrotonate tautomerase family protein [Dolichospermum sp. ST_sed